MPAIVVRQAQLSDENEIAKMCSLLWPDASLEEHRKDIGLLLKSVGISHLRK